MARRPADHDVVDPLPGRHRGRVEAEVLEQAQRPGGQPVAADLVAGEARLVDHHHVAPGAGERDGGRGAGRAGAHDDDVGGAHQGATLPGAHGGLIGWPSQPRFGPGRYVARKVSFSVRPSGQVRVRVVVTVRHWPFLDSLIPVCSPVAWGVE